MNNLRDIENEPAFLEKHGFTRRDEETTDPVRSVWYERAFAGDDRQLKLIVQVQIELFISDNPNVPTIDNFSYSFDGVFLVVIHRGMERITNLTYDEDTEVPRAVGRVMLKIMTLRQLKAFCAALESGPAYSPGIF